MCRTCNKYVVDRMVLMEQEWKVINEKASGDGRDKNAASDGEVSSESDESAPEPVPAK